MKTLYELLEVKENANKEEIELAYNNKINIESDEKRRNQLSIARDILLDDMKRKKYDNDLSNLRAEELLKNVQTSKPEEMQEEKKAEAKESVNTVSDEGLAAYIMEEAQRQIVENNKKAEKENDKEINFKKIEEEEYQKALKKEEKLRKKKIKQAERDYKDAYAEAYHAELKKMGYDVKAPWTRRRVKNLLISIVSIIIVLFVAWQIPYVRNFLHELYESNFVVKIICDIFISIIDSIKQLFIK